jgi:CheY-like chemotaxis protein
VDKGSLFHFEIPVRVAEGSELPARPAPDRVAGLKPGQPEARVLIVDDDPYGRGWVAELLRSIGFEVREADRGEVAIHLWREWKPPLILMDFQMPGMNGLEATRRIKAEANGKPPVIIALTASALDGQREAVMGGGVFDDFLSKPCREGELLERIRAHLNLEYRYAAGQTVPEPDGCAAPGPAMGAELLAKLPMDWIDQLRNAVLNGEKDRLDRLIRRVEQLDAPAARSLQEVADRYEYDILARWFEEAAETSAERQAQRT